MCYTPPVRRAAMRTVSYLSESNFPHHLRGKRFPSQILRTVRSRWHAESELPLVRIVTLRHPQLPEPFDGLRLAQVSDVHAGNYMPPARLTRVRELVEALGPDLVVFTGDQLDRRDVDADIFVHGFAGLDAPLGLYGVLGNHDHMAGAQLAIEALTAVGITPLVNGAALLERGSARLLVAGVDDLDAPPGWGPQYSVVRRTQADFRLLLCHQPNGWPQGAAQGAEITLSGHTHGGQITHPSGRLNLARLATPFVVGPYLRGDAILFVSRGVGVSGLLPMRYGSPPEIDLITLRRGLVPSAS